MTTTKEKERKKRKIDKKTKMKEMRQADRQSDKDDNRMEIKIVNSKRKRKKEKRPKKEPNFRTSRPTERQPGPDGQTSYRLLRRESLKLPGTRSGRVGRVWLGRARCQLSPG